MTKRNTILWTLSSFFFLQFGMRANANTYVPNTFTDPVITTLNNATGQINGGATISLRSALMAADNLGGTHTVTLSTGTYNLTQAIPNRQITIGNTNQNITINGNGPANTIINNTLDANKDRILFINPSGVTNSPVISVNGIRFQNGYLSSDPYGGAAICAGGGSGESLTVTNCAFDNNVLPANAYGGAAVCMQVRGNLTIDNSTFTNNVSNDADGGAVLFIIFNSSLGTGFGSLNVTNSTFTGNSVVFPGAGTANGGALAFTGQAGVTPFNVTVTNNTFVNNTADGLGGAMVANNSPNLSVLQIHFNRFYNNTSAASALSSGLHFAESSGSVNAENNWWGCNSNPVNGSSTSPCNQAGGDVAGGGTLDANPWLQLKVSASPGTICNTTPTNLGNTSTVTASFLNNSDGTAIPEANLSRLIGLPVSWGPTTLGSLSAQQGTIQTSGKATALFTSNGTGGTATVNAQVDNVPPGETSPSRASIIVNTTPIMTLHPLSQSKCDPSSVTFTATSSGIPLPTVQWQVSTNGGMSFTDIGGATSTSLTFTAVYADNGKQFRAVFTNICNVVNSNPATLTVFPIEYPQFAYSKDAYCQMGTEDPLPIIYGTPGGVFSATAGLSIHPTTGMIDVSASTLGGPYTITYNTNGPCPKTSTFAVSIVNCIPTATMTDVISIDNGSMGVADPNDRIKLTATINNAQAADYNGMQLILNNDPRVTFVSGSIKTTPLAINDLYGTTLNTSLMIPLGTGLLSNDFDNNIPGLSVTAFDPASTQGGTVSVNPNGSFTYNPMTGFTGNDTFNYTITDSDMQTNSGTVKIHVQ